ncbi:diaminopropionate ammonia-lyase [Nonomuraea maritima]|uniref:Diaminopropionate ammonia-lyase n=1 Tax=Nonomuraea maritima TaxID=683260 RepID=A0A1G9CQM6_9ACTN|nr:diaminopropionate ammonia-lyase [Nonomuraea maritima]
MASVEFPNPGRAPYSAQDRELIATRHVHRARAHFARRRDYRPTPVHAIPGLAGTRTAHLKDESTRLGIGSFKALGGGYAVHRLAQRHPDGPPFVCASAGNHGLSVAAAAAEAGVPCVVHLSDDVPEPFARRLRALGADVRRAGPDYDTAMATAQQAAREHGWRLVADSSWDGYTEIPLDVMRGYGVLLDELADTCEPPTHVFVQAGVGGLAAATAAYVRDRWGEAPRIVVVEPHGAPCLLESARAGRPVRVTGSPTTLGRLDCHEPSLLAHRLLTRLADLYMTVTDEQASGAAHLLARHGIALSGCGAAGAAGLLALSPSARDTLALDQVSRVFLVGTEGPVEPM